MIAITFALPAESAGLMRSLMKRREAVVNETRFLEGKWQGREIALCHTGVGAKVCEQRIRDFLNAIELSCLISAGFAGALVDSLRVGELFVAENFSDQNLLALSRKILAGYNPYFGKIVTVPAVIENANTRMELRAKSGAIAVDMETELIAEACARHALPLLSLRAISDTPSDPFPAPAEVLFDLERQKTDLRRLGRYLLGHPARVVPLLRFARSIARARITLTDALAALVRSGEF